MSGQGTDNGPVARFSPATRLARLQLASLAQALEVAAGEVVALVGGGGKTTAMFLLARELAAQGLKVVVTTTTHIWPPGPDYGLGVTDSLDYMRAGVKASQEKVVVVAAGRVAGKLKGIDPSWVESLREVADVILVEADGSAGRPLKAPLSHEPVIPASATLVVPVAGLDAIGKPLGKEWVHRPERVAVLAGLKEGEAITPQAVARVILHPQGSARGAPAQARLVPLLNKADTPREVALAEKVAQHLVARWVNRVVISCLAADPPRVWVFPEVAET